MWGIAGNSIGGAWNQIPPQKQSLALCSDESTHWTNWVIIHAYPYLEPKARQSHWSPNSVNSPYPLVLGLATESRDWEQQQLMMSTTNDKSIPEAEKTACHLVRSKHDAYMTTNFQDKCLLSQWRTFINIQHTFTKVTEQKRCYRWTDGQTNRTYRRSLQYPYGHKTEA